MLKQLQKGITFNIKKLSQKGILNQLNVFQKFYFSGGHHSGSESDHDHHHSSTSTTDTSESEDHLSLQRNRIFKTKVDRFSVDSILESLKTPLIKKENQVEKSTLKLFDSDKQYIDFLTLNFEKHALKKYPDYKLHLNEFKSRIPNYEKINSYQREVLILETYMIWKLEKLRDESVTAFEASYKSPLDQIKHRLNLISSKKYYKLEITAGDSHHHDDRIIHHLKEKLQEVITTEVEFEEFKHSYNKEIESNLISKVIEKKNVFFEIAQNKTETNKKLTSLTSPMNPKRPIYDATYEEHIHPQHWLENPKQVLKDKHKYLAYFDLILDNHMRQVRPNNVYDDPFAYVKPNYKPFNYSENDFGNNMYYEYFFSLDNEIYKAFKHDIKLIFQGKEDQIGQSKMDHQSTDHHSHSQVSSHGSDKITDAGHHDEHHDDSHHGEKHHEVDVDEDPNRPTMKLWKDKHKFPHVADRLGWSFLGEYPLDKNPLFERMESHPAYQWQPFVQIPPLNPHEDINFEQGETIYENRAVKDWVWFWRILFLMIPIPLIVFIYENYQQQTVPSPEYLGRFSPFQAPYNMGQRGLDRPLMEKVKFWGKDMWMWQHWIRKSAYYVLVVLSLWVLSRFFARIGADYVTKMTYNRNRDLVFIWRTKGFTRQRLEIFELHYLEQYCPHLVMGWNHMGQFKEDGIITVTDLRIGAILSFYNEKKYWNLDQREHFLHNTTTYWRGLRDKHVDKGMIIDNHQSIAPADADHVKKTQNEIKLAIEKFGPCMMNDYNYHYKYQFFKKIFEEKNKIIKESLAV